MHNHSEDNDIFPLISLLGVSFGQVGEDNVFDIG
jgi:hypothetical protein